MSLVRNQKPNLELNNYNRRGVEAHAKAPRDAKLITEKQYAAMTDGYVSPGDVAVARQAVKRADMLLATKGPNPTIEAAKKEAQALVKEVTLARALQGWIITGREALREQNIFPGYSEDTEGTAEDLYYPRLEFIFPSM
jgi:hypothetical protein